MLITISFASILYVASQLRYGLRLWISLELASCFIPSSVLGGHRAKTLGKTSACGLVWWPMPVGYCLVECVEEVVEMDFDVEAFISP